MLTEGTEIVLDILVHPVDKNCPPHLHGEGDKPKAIIVTNCAEVCERMMALGGEE